MRIEVLRLPVLQDNYIWLAHEAQSAETVVIDPAVAEPVLAAAEQRGWTITQIWNTHWHPDHIGGNADIKAATGCHVSGPAAEADKIDTLDTRLCEGDQVRMGQCVAEVLEVPAHTAGHIAYHLAADNILFIGDTLFAMGCGRLFEGSAEQMYRNMRRLAELPGSTLVYCAHEYTLANAEFAITVEPDNTELQQRLLEVQHARDNDEPTVPTRIDVELATNPFMRARSITELAEYRTAKDNF